MYRYGKTDKPILHDQLAILGRLHNHSLAHVQSPDTSPLSTDLIIITWFRVFLQKMNCTSIYQRPTPLNLSLLVIPINSSRVIIWLINRHGEYDYIDIEQKRVYNTLGIDPAPMTFQFTNYGKINAKRYSYVASLYKCSYTTIFLVEQQYSKLHLRGLSVNISLYRKQVLGFVDVLMNSSLKQASQLKALLMPCLFTFDRK